MGEKLQRVIYELALLEQMEGRESLLYRLDARVKLLVALLFILFLQAVSLERIEILVLCLFCPIVLCRMAGIDYARLFRRSLVCLPFVVFVGIFTPIYYTEPAFRFGGFVVSVGWVMLFSLVIRGLIAVQTVFILLSTTGFYPLCRGMERMGVPAVLVTQFLFVYRYIFVLLQEALCMHRARQARSFGRRRYGVRQWGVFVGQLLLRTLSRSVRIHRAMLARGYNGRVPGLFRSSWRWIDTACLLGCVSLLAGSYCLIK